MVLSSLENALHVYPRRKGECWFLQLVKREASPVRRHYAGVLMEPAVRDPSLNSDSEPGQAA